MNRKNNVLGESVNRRVSPRRERVVSVTELRKPSPPPDPQFPFASAGGPFVPTDRIDDIFAQASICHPSDLVFLNPVHSAPRMSEPCAALCIHINRPVDFAGQTSGRGVRGKYAVAQTLDTPSCS